MRDIETRGHFTTGAIGTRYLFRALTDAGRADLIRRVIVNPDVPGYARQLASGATALAESWTAWTGASQNHFFLGHVIEWFYRDLVGLAPDEATPGFKHMVIRPEPVDGLEWAEAEHETPHGRVAVRWEKRAGALVLTLAVPPNTTATVHVPSRGDSGSPLVAGYGVEDLGRVGDRRLYRVGPGTHRFESRW